MPRPRLPGLAWLLAVPMLVFVSPGYAAGIGKGQLKSRLGQALEVEFEIFASVGETVSERCFRLIRPFDRETGPEDVTRGTFAVSLAPGGRRMLSLTAPLAITEPVVNLTVEMSCDGSRLIRSFTFLPDLPDPVAPPEAVKTVSPAGPAATPVAMAAATAEGGGAPVASSSNAVSGVKGGSGKPRRSPPPAVSPTAGPGEAPTELRLDSGRVKPTRRGDRLSLGMLSAMLRDVDGPAPALKLSASLSFANGPIREKTPQQQALLAVERRLADRALGMSFADYDTKARLGELLGALDEVRRIAGQLPEGVELPVTAPAAPSNAGPAVASAAKSPAAASTAAAKRVPAAAGHADEDFSLVWYGVAATLALLAGYATWQWRRRAASVLAERPLSGAAKPTPDDGSLRKSLTRETLDVDVGNEQSADVDIDADFADAVSYGHPRDLVESISVSHGFDDELDDRFSTHMEAAEIMICFGRYQSAATEISDYIAENPECGLRPRLVLLDIHRRGSMRQEYAALAESLKGQYNVVVPAMGPDQREVIASRNLDSFPHVVDRLVQLWGSAECLPYIRHLTTDTRGGTRSGFDVEAAAELALLESILRYRSEKAPSPQQHATA